MFGLWVKLNEFDSTSLPENHLTVPNYLLRHGD
jgi:hypothetical protein